MWSILEGGLKLFASLGLKKKLQLKIKEWDRFLSDETSQCPKPIRNFDTEYKTDRIPDISLVEEVLGSLPHVRKIIAPKKKWRNRRNAIAHNASRFKNEQIFVEYKSDLIEAIEELENQILIASQK